MEKKSDISDEPTIDKNFQVTNQEVLKPPHSVSPIPENIRPETYFLNWLFNEFPKLAESVAKSYFESNTKMQRYAFIDRIVSLVLIIGILVGIILTYLWLVYHYPSESDKFMQVVLAFLAGGGIATLLRPLSTAKLFRGDYKDETK
jgi:hypothetical protein